MLPWTAWSMCRADRADHPVCPGRRSLPAPVRFESAAPAGLAGVERELHSAFSNLIINAMRYTDDDGGSEVRWYGRGNGEWVFEVRTMALASRKSISPSLPSASTGSTARTAARRAVPGWGWPSSSTCCNVTMPAGSGIRTRAGQYLPLRVSRGPGPYSVSRLNIPSISGPRKLNSCRVTLTKAT
jgi:hypothetical protein